MNLARFCWVAAWVLLVAGCSSTPTRVEKGPVRASTYSLMSPKGGTQGSMDEVRSKIHGVIQNAIAEELAGKGLSQVATGGDVRVGYLIVVVDNVSTKTDSDYFGYGRDAADLAKKAHKARDREGGRDYLEVGAIVIDVVEPVDSKVLYRSTARMDARNATPANSSGRISRLVGLCLADLRIEN
jgi:hypothetical protein